VVERLVIDHVGHRGDGVALADGTTVYVPYSLGGETVEVARVSGHPDRRQLLAVEAASPERVAPFCPHFGVCGGCAIQHWQPDRYRAWKQNLVVETLRQAKLDCDVAPLIDAHGLGRRRMTVHARMGTHDVLKVGFAAALSHDIVPVDRCPILDPGLADAHDRGGNPEAQHGDRDHQRAEMGPAGDGEDAHDGDLEGDDRAGDQADRQIEQAGAGCCWGPGGRARARCYQLPPPTLVNGTKLTILPL